MWSVPHNKHRQRAGNHKVLDRGRSVFALERVRLARVLTGQRAATELSR